MRLVSTIVFLAGVTSAFTLAAACAGDDDKIKPSATIAVVQDTAPAPTPELQTQPTVPQPLDATAMSPKNGIISIEARDLKFSPNHWTVALGESVTIRLANADGQQHNLRIAGLDGEYDTQDDAITVPEALNGGESGEVNFVPLVPGGYTFRCDFHPDAMGGRIEVEPGTP